MKIVEEDNESNSMSQMYSPSSKGNLLDDERKSQWNPKLWVPIS